MITFISVGLQDVVSCCYSQPWNFCNVL